MNHRKNQHKIIARIRNETRQTAGVYLFRNDAGNIIYIGKSVNLKQRMLSYFRLNLRGLETRIQQLICNIHDFEIYETDTELLALLLEDALIKKYLPYFNIRQQEFQQYRYLLLTNDRFPTCKMTSHCEDFGAQRIYGPFRDQYFTAEILSIIQRFLKLRACLEPEPIKKSLNFEFGLCTGPCRQKISQKEYSKIVTQVVAFLNGRESTVIRILNKAMAEAVTSRNFEKASDLKSKIEFCRKFCARQRFIHKFKNQDLIIHENGKNHCIYRFNRGQLTAPNSTNSKWDRFQTAKHPQIDAFSEDARFLLDKANIVYKWIHDKKNRCDYQFKRTNGEVIIEKNKQVEAEENLTFEF